MTEFIFQTERDRKLIDNSYKYLENIIFGKKRDPEILSIMEDLFNKKVSKVLIYPWGTTTKNLSTNNPGICRFDKNGNIVIEMLGYTAASRDDFKFIEHEAVHEFCHAFADILSEEISTKIVKNGIVRENSAGMIKETDVKTGQLTGHNYYGKMFNETMMDIIAAMAINNFSQNNISTTVDDVLQKHYSITGNQETNYTFFTSITRLMIAAFSNVGNIDFRYQDIVKQGESIFTLKNQLHDGTIVKANDFLYGILFDPLHIEKEFDKYMGDDSYRRFCESLDTFFLTNTLKSEIVKSIMEYIADFLNKKMADLEERRHVITLNERKNIVSNFNRIWNSMQLEYEAYFSQSDIDDIINRANHY